MAAGVRISVCVATFNGERHVREQLQSVLSQLGPDDEVIVSDDHSGDGTVAEVEAVADPRVTLIRNAETVGYSTTSLERSSGRQGSTSSCATRMTSGCRARCPPC